MIRGPSPFAPSRLRAAIRSSAADSAAAASSTASRGPRQGARWAKRRSSVWGRPNQVATTAGHRGVRILVFGSGRASQSAPPNPGGSMVPFVLSGPSPTTDGGKDRTVKHCLMIAIASAAPA